MEENETNGIRSIENTFLDKAKNESINSNIMIVYALFSIRIYQKEGIGDDENG
jgi:hypothetical protein